MGDACCGPDVVGSEEDVEQEPERLWEIRELQLGALAGLLLIVALGFERSDNSFLETITQAVALVIAGSTFVPSTVRNLIQRRINVGTLMTIAAVGAVALGQVGEAAALAFLFSISEGLEEYSLARTRRGLRALLDLVPATATIKLGREHRQVSPADLKVGDVMLVKPGERVATDGVNKSGQSTLDLSAITGESVPVETFPGDEIFAGSVNGTGPLEITVTSEADDNSLARLVRIVEEEQSRKGASQRLADRIAKPLVPAVMLAAVLIAAVGSLLGDPGVWIERALVVLVAASPCAIAIAVPVTVVSAIGASSRMGVLIKGGAALEALGTIRTVALDKTGTLTMNKPVVIEVVAVPDVVDQTVLALAASLEAQSEHPLAKAILAANDAAPEIIVQATEVQATPGAGISGQVSGSHVRLGRPGWIKAPGLTNDIARLQTEGATTVLVERDGTVLGAIGVRDELRPEAAEVISLLKRSGYSVAMVTGDNERTARAIATAASIEDVHADLRPEDKANLVRVLQSKQPTAMVGDGINDAPALATADSGIAMGAMGSDVAVEAADVALMGEDLRSLLRALQHSRRARRIMLQNLVFSLALIIVLMPLALLGVLSLAAVVLIHEVAEIFVIANGVRAGRISKATREVSK